MIPAGLLRAAAPYLIGAALLLGVGFGIRWYGNSNYEAGIAACEAKHNLAELEEYKAQATKLSGLSGQLESGLEAMRDAKPKIIEKYTRVEVQSPLPAGCVRDPERVRSTNEAIGEANATRKFVGPVPANSNH